MSDTDTKIIDDLNDLADKRFLVQIKIDDANASHKSAVAALVAAHERVLSALTSEAAGLDQQIAAIIQPNRGSLIERGKQSFVIMRAKFQFRKPSGKTKITDAAGIMDVARKLGVVRQIAKPSYVWKLNQSKFFDWLDKHGEMRTHFEEYLDDSSKESLTMQPNAGHTVHHDSKRISPPSVSIALS